MEFSTWWLAHALSMVVKIPLAVGGKGRQEVLFSHSPKHGSPRVLYNLEGNQRFHKAYCYCS